MSWPEAAALPPPAPGRIVVADQSAGGRLVVLEAATQRELRMIGSWSPAREAVPGHRRHVPEEAWGRPTEVRLRRTRSQEPCVLVCDSYGAIVLLDPLTGGARWADLGRTANPHAIEILPDDSVVVAASTGGWVRRYRLEGSGSAELVAECELADAHGLWWDAGSSTLWALGGTELVQLRVLERTFERVEAWELPSPHGHDLQPVEHLHRRLWVTTERDVLQFDLQNRAFSTETWGLGVGFRRVKSIDGGPRTRVLLAAPTSTASDDWLTNRVREVHQGAVRELMAPLELYKARKWEELE